MPGQFCDNFIMTEDGENFEMTQTTKGDPGEGVPTGGTAGQVLKKVSGDDYDTEWADLDAGDVGFDSTETYQSGTVGAELSDLSRQLSDETTGLDTKAPVILETASGAIASFDDGADEQPIRKLVAQIEPVQDLNGYDNPWPAGGGTNKTRYPYVLSGTQTNNGITFTINSDGTVTANGTATGTAQIDLYGTIQTNLLQLENGKTYTVSGTDVYGTAIDYYVYKNGSTLTEVIGRYNSPATYSVPDDGNTYACRLLPRVISGTTVTNAVFKPMLAEGSTALPFTPYSNICPISGWTGADVNTTGINIWDEEWELGIIVGNGAIQTGNRVVSKNYIPVVPNNTYCMTYGGTGRGRGAFYDINYNFVEYYGDFPQVITTQDNKSIGTFTVPDGAYFFKFCTHTGYVDDYNHDISINYPSTDTSYHAYDGSQISVTFPSSAGTVYGGTLTINPDRTGTLVVDRVCKTLTVARNLSTAYPGSIIYNASSPETSDANLGNAFICNQLRYVGSSSTSANWKYGTCINANGGSFNLWIKDSAFSNLEEATAWLESNETQICYELATPITYTLTPTEIDGILTTLYGTNNIWADVGPVSVEYPADTKLYIDGKIADAIAALGT